ncbi:MAG: DNA-3-methyladenine glycosylase [Verrucomicrobiota bacterium]
MSRSFYERPVLEVAEDLLGKLLVHGTTVGRVVETEAYAVEGDPACHTAHQKKARQFVARHPAGTSYVYLNYGVHWLFNLFTKYPSGDGLVLVRALEPVAGVQLMQERRNKLRLRDLCSGPGKIGQALAIGPDQHEQTLWGRGQALHLRDDGRSLGPVARDLRIGISKAVDFPWRFLLPESEHLSVPLTGKVS